MKNIFKSKQKTTIDDVSPFNLNPHHLTILNIWKKFPTKLWWMFVSAFLFNLGIATFLAKAGTVASGTSALIQVITYTFESLRQYFAIFYLLINLPFIIIFWKKNSRMFMILTLYWLLFQIISEFFFYGFDSSKPYVIRDWLQHDFSIYYTSYDLDGSKVTWTVYPNGNFDAPNIIGKWQNWTLQEDVFNDSTKNLVKAGVHGWTYFKELNPHLNINIETWPVIIYTLGGSILGGLAAAIAWKHSGSTAGSDVFIYYISRVKKISVGKVSFRIAACFATFSIVVIGILEYTGNVLDHPWNSSVYLVRCLSTVFYISFYNLIINFIYPKYKKIKIEIYSSKIDVICAHFKAINYWHAYSIVKQTSGFTQQDNQRIETIALFLEQNEILREIHKVDPNAWINVIPVLNVKGKFNTQKVE
ncbi:YitT family protein [Mycoplasma miroungirhinis]|uniref:YitT family protein n=1 Tax=Mycoplasma miroungirhinis TaxID=754516 RepID=A0A6M4JEJ5_9MOLU|nr:YitT family protein [Mycoplasma miroungirhinis]QJR44419.1 YitT family protein [Mycoplasma miroungirhinis]